MKTASSTMAGTTMSGKLDVLKFFSEDTRSEVEALIEELGLIPVSIEQNNNGKI